MAYMNEDYKNLVSLNNSLEERLTISSALISNRDKEITMLQVMLKESGETKSKHDDNLEQLHELQLYINEMLPQLTYPDRTIKQDRVNVDGIEQLKAIKQQYMYLQTLVQEQHSQLLEIKSRNLVLQMQAARVAELESLLTDFNTKENF